MYNIYNYHYCIAPCSSINESKILPRMFTQSIRHIFLFRDRCRSNNTKWQFARYNIWQVIKRTKTKTEEMRGYFFFSNTVFIVFLRFLVINGIIYICIYILNGRLRFERVALCALTHWLTVSMNIERYFWSRKKRKVEEGMRDP